MGNPLLVVISLHNFVQVPTCLISACGCRAKPLSLRGEATYPVPGQMSFEQIMNALFACGNLKMAVVGIFYCASLH